MLEQAPSYQPAPLPSDEAGRLLALRALEVLDTAPEPVFDDLAALAAGICEAPIALVSLVEDERQWFKARCGLDADETGRAESFCAWAMLQDAVFEVPDARADDRFAGNPLVIGAPYIRFYAGAPLVGRSGDCYGALCVIDTRPRTLSNAQHAQLSRLARLTANQLEMRRERLDADRQTVMLATLLETMPTAAVTCDSEGKLRQFNRLAREWHGTDPRRLPPEQWAVHFDLYEADGHTPLATDRIPLLRAFRGEEVRDARIVIKSRDQGPRAVVCNGSRLISADGQVLGAIVLMHDITAIVATKDELRRSNAELEQFAYIASHDLQEPLRTVTNFSQLLTRRYGQQLDSDGQEFLNYVAEGGRRAQALIGDLLSVARLSAEGRPFEPVPLARLLDQVEGGLRALMADSGATLTRDAVLPVVHADASQIAQLLQNLLSNAIKFRGEAAPRVHVGASLQPDGRWRISVADNGIGIDAKFHERVFELFKRLHPRSDYHGTGIGLAICKKVVERHGGRIGVESVPGRGATFWFTLPATVPAEARLG